MTQVNVAKDIENKTLTIDFLANAPKEKVWKAYANKEWFEKWWGPEGWQTTVKEFNFTPGGRVHYGMECVDKDQGEWFGQVSWGMMILGSVNEPTSFTYTDYFSDENGTQNQEMPVIQNTVELTQEGEVTRVICRCVAESADKIEELVKMGMVEGFTSQLNRLEALLSE